jgi:glutamate synthase domain-containing protein 1
MSPRPQPYGLYDPRFEHDACGLGALVRLDGNPTHELVDQAITVLENLDHRGATGSDAQTGDGAGILTQVPDRFLRRVCRDELDVELPAVGEYAVGTIFLPRDPGLRLRCEELFVRIVVEEGHRVLGWRDVPVRSASLGRLAREAEPVIRQVFIERRTGDDEAFARKLYVIRRRIEKGAHHEGVGEDAFFVPSLSARTLVYKGLLRAAQLRSYYPDLGDPDYASAICLVHSRFSTNTLGTWDLAHPFNYVAHNGEINTVRGNANWLSAREPQLRSELFGGDLQKLFPIAEDGWSDSAKLDAAVELLVLGGRPLEHVLAMLIPPAWSDPSLQLDDDVRAFYEYHANLTEPWDGPAAIVATDGVRVAATLDRNGLRPARYVRTSDGLVVLASEIGVLDIEPSRIVESGRLEPGRMLLLDTHAGRVVPDAEIKRVLARRRPYRRWLDEHKLFLDDLRPQPVAPIPSDELGTLQRAFGYTAEDLNLLMAPMAREGVEPNGSMGDDTPLAALSERPKLLRATSSSTSPRSRTRRSTRSAKRS